MDKLKHGGKIHGPQIIACLWDFDQTLIPGYMQKPLFKHFNVDEKQFWAEVNALPEIYAKRGVRASKDTIYLNHLLTYVKGGRMPGLSNALLRELGKQIEFYPGMPELMKHLCDFVHENEAYAAHDIRLEHYVISTGLKEMIKGSAVAPYLTDIFGCELIEQPLAPGFAVQDEFPLEANSEVSQIGFMVDNTIKTRFVFEVNKGTNKRPSIDVNAKIAHHDRRVPIEQMIYVADGPSDVPTFSVVRDNGGKTLAVYDPTSQAELKQNDALLRAGRIDYFSSTDYSKNGPTARWLEMQIAQIAENVIQSQEQMMQARVGKVPQHLHKDDVQKALAQAEAQTELFDGASLDN